MQETLLNTVKKLLGIDADYEAFDVDILMFINGALLTLAQLGVPTLKRTVTATDTPSNIFPLDSDCEALVSYMYLKVRLQFDPPSNSFVVDSFQKQINEYEWRLNVSAESVIL